MNDPVVATIQKVHIDLFAHGIVVIVGERAGQLTRLCVLMRKISAAAFDEGARVVLQLGLFQQRVGCVRQLVICVYFKHFVV